MSLPAAVRTTGFPTAYRQGEIGNEPLDRVSDESVHAQTAEEDGHQRVGSPRHGNSSERLHSGLQDGGLPFPCGVSLVPQPFFQIGQSATGYKLPRDDYGQDWPTYL